MQTTYPPQQITRQVSYLQQWPRCLSKIFCIHFAVSSGFFLLIAASAAEAMGQEETAADYSAMESFGTNDDQQVHITFKLQHTGCHCVGKAVKQTCSIQSVYMSLTTLILSNKRSKCCLYILRVLHFYNKYNILFRTLYRQHTLSHSYGLSIKHIGTSVK